MGRANSWGVVLFVLATSALLGGCGSGSSSPPISVSLSPSSPPAIDLSQPVMITATVTNDPSNRGVSWTLTGPGSLSNPAGFSTTYSSAISGLISEQQVTIKATSLADQTVSASLQITVNPYPVIPFQTLANGSVGTPYSQTISLDGGTAPFQWSVYNGSIITGFEVGGAVPDGLNLDPNTGKISGTPTGAGTWYFEATLTDAAGVGVINGFMSIQINPTPAPGHPVPFLNQPLLPTAVSPGTLGFTLSVSGTGFVPGATIDFNSAPLATIFVDSGHLTATVPAVDIASAGTVSVTVVNPGPGGGPSNVVDFQIAAPESTVSFASAANSPLQISEALGIATADFNEDGKADLVVTGNIHAYVFLGNGDGTFAPAANSPMSIPSPPFDDFASPYVGPITVGRFQPQRPPGSGPRGDQQ